MARAAYHLLGRRTFLTTGDKESRAWTFRAGAKAPECAGVIHSDLQRGFIRAEVIRWDELSTSGSWTAAKAAGQAAGRGQGLRGRRRRRPRDPFETRDDESCRVMTAASRLLRDGDVPPPPRWRRASASARAGCLGAAATTARLGAPADPLRDTVGMRSTIDVAFVDKELVVIDTLRMPPWRVSLPRLRARSVIEAEAGRLRAVGLNRRLQLEGSEKSGDHRTGELPPARPGARPPHPHQPLLGDLSPRAVQTLKAADVVCCKDTRRHVRACSPRRHTGKGCCRCTSHNEAARLPGVLTRVAIGEVVAEVSDAGTPGVSGPRRPAGGGGGGRGPRRRGGPRPTPLSPPCS